MPRESLIKECLVKNLTEPLRSLVPLNLILMRVSLQQAFEEIVLAHQRALENSREAALTSIPPMQQSENYHRGSRAANKALVNTSSLVKRLDCLENALRNFTTNSHHLEQNGPKCEEQSSYQYSKSYCNYCKKRGHTKTECHKWLKQKVSSNRV